MARGLLLLVAFAALAAADHADQPQIESSDGDIVLSVPDGKAVYIHDGDKTKVATEASIDELNEKIQQLQARVAELENTVALKADVPTKVEIGGMVDDILADPNSNLYKALLTKADVAAVLTLDDVTDQVNAMATSGGNELKKALDALTGRLDLVFKQQCGAPCSPGTYVTTPCDGQGQQTVCGSCPANTYSLGGLAPTCTDCSECMEDEFLAAQCTLTSDTKCTKCKTCDADSEFQKAPCTATTDTMCTACTSCGADEFEMVPCSGATDRTCKKCSSTTCPGDQILVTPCGGMSDIVCRPKYAGFRAVLSKTVNVGAASWFPIVGAGLWNTAAAGAGTFNGGDNFKDGIFTAPETGYYYASAMIRIDGASNTVGHYFRIMISQNNRQGVNDGFHNIDGAMPNTYETLVTSGITKLNKGDTLRVYIFSSDTASYSIQYESGFSVMQLDVREGVSAEKDGSSGYGGGWNYITRWRTTQPGSFKAGSASFDEESGVYVVREGGYFFASANIRLDNAQAAAYMRLLFVVNGQLTLQNGLHAIQGATPAPYYSMHVSGVMKLNTGDRVQVAIESQDASWSVQDESSFSIVGLNNPTQGFSVDVLNDRPLTQRGWQEVGGFTTTTATSLFNLNNALDLSSGRFTAPVDGIYLFSANIRMDGVDGRYARMAIGVGVGAGFNEAKNQGLHMIKGTPITSNYISFTATGVVHMNAGDVAQVLVYLEEDISTNLQHESGFSAVLVVPGGMCASCAEGFTEETPCSVNANRKCKACAQSCTAGQYAATSCTQATDRSCKSCTVCPQYYVQVAACTNVSDTVCVPSVSMRARKTKDTTITNMVQQFAAVPDWETSNAAFPSLHLKGPSEMFAPATGKFTAPYDGYYWVSASVRIDDANGQYFRLIVAVNNNLNVNNGLHAIRGVGSIPANYYSFTVSGTLYLKKGNTLQPMIYSEQDSSYIMQTESGFSVTMVDISEGMNVEMSASQSVTTTGVTTVGNWRADQAGGFAASTSNKLGNGFDPITGIYTVHEDGLFLVDANMRLDGANGAYFRLYIVIDGSIHPSNGLHSILGSPTAPYYTLHVSGQLFLRRGQNLRVVVHSENDAGWSIQHESGFSVVRVKNWGGVGFFADMRSSFTAPHGGWFEVNNYRADDLGMYNYNNSLNLQSGRFTAPLAGVYICAANLRIDDSQSPYIRMVLVAREASSQPGVGSVSESYNNGAHLIYGSNPTNYVTLSQGASFALKAGDQMSVYAFSNDGGAWVLQDESGFSCALVAPDA